MDLKERKRLINEFIKAETKIAEKTGSAIQFGKLSDFKTTGRENFMLTGILGFDCNTNGFKKGTFNVIYGQESGGKSTLTLEACAGFQLTNPYLQILYVDSEGTLDESFIARIPYLKKDNIYFFRNNVMENIFGKIEEVLKLKLFDVIIIDSIDTMITLAEKEKTLEDNTMMDKARILSRALARINDDVVNNGVIFILIQQERINMSGIFQVKTHGRSGGNAMKFYPSVVYRISKKTSENEIEKAKSEIEGTKLITQFVKIYNEKSKISESLKETVTYINIDTKKKMGVQKLKELVDYLIYYGIITIGGAWIEYLDLSTGEIKKVQGRDNFAKMIYNNLDLFTQLKIQVYAKTLPPELLIVQFDNIKKMLEQENFEIKEQKRRLCIATGKESALSETDTTKFSFGEDFKITDLIDEETYKEGLFNIENTYKTSDEIEEEQEVKKTKKSKKEQIEKDENLEDNSEIFKGE